ncbi:thiamine-phosphate kinase [uncultured Corynebacterium sp.]|uniref:thiamine-phosphate kinase n=1 Tax=uncultured Corynebacterium sp. TaxID=159447 RepID=UPI0025CCED6B|nr:thiamine-phosphate kinase [uncultured Corynebacterium sp.]
MAETAGTYGGHAAGGPTVSQVGEAATIAAIREAAPSEVNGDDAAVLDPAPPNSRHIATTDVLVDSEHFRLDWSTPYEVGVKAVSQNFADIQAMGGRPTAVLMSLSAPADLPVGVVGDIARGIGAAATPWGVELVGGDVVTSRQLIVAVTAIGILAGPDPALTVDAARPGHLVVASGVIGHSAAGLALLKYYGSRAAVPDNPVLQDLVSRHCAPHLIVGRGSVGRAAGMSAMTDNSDGLVHDLTTVARRSGVIVDLDGAALTPDAQLYYAADITGDDPWEWVLTGGEDHTLLGTTDKEPPAGYRVIGEIRDAGDAERFGELTDPVTVDGQRPLYATGWDSL